MDMRIESLRLKNFKAFRDVEVRGLGGMCVFVGANGTGKTTLFDVFGFLKDALQNNVRQALVRRGGFHEVVSRGEKGPIELEIRFRAPDSLVSPLEEFKRLVPNYQKLRGASAIGPCLDIANGRSASFRAFIDGVRRLAARP